MSINKKTEIAQAPTYPSHRHNPRERKVLETSNQYAPANASDWATAPAIIDDALDALAAANSGGKLKTLSVTYDFSVNGGAVGAVSLGASLPAKAIVVEVIADVLTQVAGSGNIKLTVPTEGALQTGSIDSSDAVGPQFATAAAPVKTAAARALQATIASAVVTAGKVQFFVRYYQGS